MIVLKNLTKIFHMRGRSKVIMKNMNVVFPTGASIALMGRNGAGKSSLMQMIAGSLDPTSGEILSDGTISWPVGFAGSFHPDLTGSQNVRFIARIYGIDTDAMLEFVEDFAELGPHFHLPVRSYSSGMKSRLAFGSSVAVPFDTYLIDEVMSVGDTAFKKKSTRVLKARLETSGAVVVSHSTNMIRQVCDAGAVLENGQMTYYEDIEEAIEHHEYNMNFVKAGG